QIRAAAGLCRGHVQSLALRPLRHRLGRGASGERSETAAIARGAPRGGRWRSIRKAVAISVVAGLIAAGSFSAWVVSLGPLPLEAARKVSTTILNRNVKPIP